MCDDRYNTSRTRLHDCGHYLILCCPTLSYLREFGFKLSVIWAQARDPAPKPSAVRPLLPVCFFILNDKKTMFYASPPTLPLRNAFFVQKFPFRSGKTPPVFKSIVFYSGCAFCSTPHRKIIPKLQRNADFDMCSKALFFTVGALAAVFSFVKTHTSLTPSWKTNVLNTTSCFTVGALFFA